MQSKVIESAQYAAERRQAIARVIEEKTRASVIELSKRLSVSEVTIRKDLAVLEEVGTSFAHMAAPSASAAAELSWLSRFGPVSIRQRSHSLERRQPALWKMAT